MRSLLALLIILTTPTAYAASEDTHIAIKYQIRSTRVRPTPSQGVTTVNIKIVLHANGTIEDVVGVEGDKPKQWELKSRKLGHHATGAEYRVIDSNTIVRTFADPKTHVYTVKIAVNGSSCKADVTFKLKPQQKEFAVYSTKLGTAAYYSQLEPFDIECKIE
jgi:hypothetical protein